jgi:hypothetical protein
MSRPDADKPKNTPKKETPKKETPKKDTPANKPKKETPAQKAKNIQKAVEKKVPQNKTTLTKKDYAKAAKYAATDKTKVDDTYMGNAAKKSAAGLEQAKKNLEAAKKSGNKSKIALAKGQLDTATTLNTALSDVLKRMGFDTVTGTSTTASIGPFSGNRSDADYVASGRSGTSNTGKNYIDGVEASDEEWNIFLKGNKDNEEDGPAIAPTQTSADNAGGETSIDVLKSVLKGMGFNSKIIESSSSYLSDLLRDGITYDNAVQLFLNSKDYTLKDGKKIESPFYKEYGYLNEGLVDTKTAAELYNAVEGYKGIVDKYQLSNKYLEVDSLKKYVKNNVTVADLDERANMARLKAVSADTNQVNALIKLGFIGSAKDLTDFYLDPAIGKNQLEQNRVTGAFTAEALRRASSGIEFDKERFTQYGAMLAEKNISEAQASQIAGQAFETIGEQLNATTMLSGIYERGNAATSGTIQKELESEQLLGMASERRKRLKTLGESAFQGSSGLYGQTGAFGGSSVSGLV